MRRHLVWPLAVPLSVLGVLAAHWLSYRLVVPDAHARGHLLAATGHGYLAYAPLIVGVSVALILLGFGAAIVRELRGGQGAYAPPWVVAFLPPLTFVAQEYLERYSHHGRVEWSVAFEATFLVGLALQLPFALAAAVTTLVLVRVARGVAAILSRRPVPSLRSLRPFAAPALLDLPRMPMLALGYAGRAPPPQRC
jgi:hypothetical protein